MQPSKNPGYACGLKTQLWCRWQKKSCHWTGIWELSIQ